MAEPFLTLAQICDRYHVSDRRARDIIREHAVPVLRPGRHFLFDARAETEFRLALQPDYKLSAQDILAQATPARISAIYFLIEGDEIVYVGQAVHLIRRMTQHLGRIKFDRFSYVPCPEADLDRVEARYIAALRPRLNKAAGYEPPYV